MHVLVTGGAGFVGSHVVEQLARRGERVTVLDIVGPTQGVNASAGSVPAPYGQVEFLKGSVLDLDAVHDAASGVDAVVHLAGLVRSGIRRRPHEGATLQLQGTLNVLEACRANQVPHLGYASSFYVYDGHSTEQPVDETTQLDPACMELFGSAKFMGELLCHDYAGRNGLGVTVFRIGPVYGGAGSSAVDDFFATGLREGVIQVWGSGERRNQYTYVGDVAEALIAGLTHPGATYNVVAPEAVGMRELAGMFDRYGIRAEFDTSRPEGPNLPYIRHDKTATELGWQPRPLTAGLAEVYTSLTSVRG